jgi:hypothetical protein
MALPDELRFGARGILNLRDGLPTAHQAVERADRWLREHQINRTAEVLVVTGRGQGSVGGTPVLRPAIEKLLFALRRQGVVSDAPRRARDRSVAEPAADIHGLSTETIQLLRDLAERSLESLGVTPDARAIDDEMHRHLRLLARGLSSDADTNSQLQRAIRSLIADYD